MSQEIRSLFKDNHENIGDPVVTEVYDSWYDGYRNGNIHHPKDAIYGIATFAGKEMIASLRTGRVDLSYVAQSKMTLSQFLDLQDHVVKAHRAHNITVMPSGRAESAEKEFDVHFWLEGNWHDIKRSFVRALAYTAADMHPTEWWEKMDEIPVELRDSIDYPGPHENDYSENLVANNLAEQVISERFYAQLSFPLELINEFQQTQEYQSVLPIVGKFYTDSVNALESSEGRTIAQRRRNALNPIKPYVFDPQVEDIGYLDPRKADKHFAPWERARHYEWELIYLIRQELAKTAELFSVSDSKIYGFLEAVTGHPMQKVKEVLDRVHYFKTNRDKRNG